MRSRPSTHRFVLAALVAPVLLLAGAGRDVRAATLSWNNPAGGSASTASNWSPVQVPTPADLLIFDLNNTFTTTFNAATATSLSMLLRDGAVSLAFSSPHTVSSAIRFADTSQDTLTAKITSGTLTCTSFVGIGQFNPCRANVEVRGGTGVNTLLDLTSAANGNLVVGGSGTGTLDVTSGGKVRVAKDVTIGSTSTSTGVLTVSGFSQSPFSTSTLTTTQATGDIFVALGGNGQLNVLGDFGFVSCAGNLYIAPEEHPGFDGNGVVTVGNTSDFAPLLSVDHDLWIGGGFGIGGDATLNIVGNGVVQVDGTTHIGSAFAANPDAVLRTQGAVVNESPVLRTHGLTIHEFSVLDFRTGTITVDGGALDTGSEPLTISGTGGSPTLGPRLVLTNGATCTLPDPGFPDPSMTLGATTFGGARLDSGAVLTLDGNLDMGQQALGSGDLTMTHGARLVAQDINGGIDGAATIQVNSASTISCKRIRLGADGAPGSAIMTLNGPDTNASVEDGVRIGVFASAPQSSMTLMNSATLESLFDFAVEKSGRLAIQSGSQVTVSPGTVRNNGKLELEDGFVIADTVLVQTNGELKGNGWAGTLLVNQGIVSPGLSAGRIEVLGAKYVQTATGKLRIDLGNHATSEWDTLTVLGPAVLDGTLELTKLPTFSVGANQKFTILTCTSRTGTFSNVTLNGGPLVGFVMEYTGTTVAVKANGATDAAQVAAAPAKLELLGQRTGRGAAFELALPVAAHARLSVYDVTGREVRVLRDAATAAGRHRFDLDGASTRLPSGVYFGRAVVAVPGAAPETRTARVVIVR